MNIRTKAHFALLTTAIFFSLNFTAVKYLINGNFTQPFGLNFLRVGITALLLIILYFFKSGKDKIQKKDYGRFFLCAATGIAFNQLLFMKGLSLTTSIHASLLLLITPILITFIAAWVLKERLTVYKLIGLGLGIGGALVLILAKENTGNSADMLWGDILIILNAIFYTIYFVLVKPLMRDYDPITVLRIIFTLGFFMIIPFCWTEFTQIPWHNFTLKEYLTVALVVFGGTFCAYLFNIYGIKILGASIAGTYIYLQPLFASAIAMAFLGEELSAYKIFAGVLIFAGVYLANKQTSQA